MAARTATTSTYVCVLATAFAAFCAFVAAKAILSLAVVMAVLIEPIVFDRLVTELCRLVNEL